MGPKLRGAPPDGETEIQRFMREMHERDEEQRIAFQDRDDAAAAAILVIDRRLLYSREFKLLTL